MPHRRLAEPTYAWRLSMFITFLVSAALGALNPYTVRVTPVVVVQGGPVVVDVEVVYIGFEPVTVQVDILGRLNGFHVDTPQGWSAKRTPERNLFHFGITTYWVEVKHGKTVTRHRLHLEKEFAGTIPPGEVTVTVRWDGGADLESGRIIHASGSTRLSVTPLVPQTVPAPRTQP